MSKNVIVFDFDGVLFDSFDVALKSIQKICPVRTAEEYKKLFEGNIYATNWKEELNHTSDCRHDLEYFDVYTPLMLESKLFPQAEAFIKKLSNDFNLIIVSSSQTEDIRTILTKNNLSSYFTEIMGKDVEKSKIKKLQIVLDKYNKAPKDILFITDTLGDLKEAAHLNIPSIGVTWGWHSNNILEAGNPIKIVDNFKQLENEIETYFKK